MKLQTAIQNAYQKLKNSNIKSALIDSELLMANTIKKSRDYIILNANKNIDKQNYYNFQKMVTQRSRGKPIAYLMNEKFFWKHKFFVNKDVLIPRPETEIIIEQVLKIYKNKNKINFLDIGFGSGCIILSILKERKDFMASGVDISNKALKVCKINASRLGIKNRLKLFNSDIDKFSLGKYDLIISNPPYIKKLDLKYLEKDIIKFEPKLALDGGLDGISEISSVINKSSELIKKNGKFLLEIASDQKRVVKKLLKNKGFYINRILKDYGNNDRCIVSTKT